MAIFHMSFQNISAGKMRSSVASASYRSGERLFSDKEGKTYFYKRDIMPESFILTPKNAPEWAKDRNKLWNVEHKNGYLFQIAVLVSYLIIIVISNIRKCILNNFTIFNY